jgi:hypothetical protein
MTDTNPNAEPTATGQVEYHLVRGALWGLSLGIGLAIYAVLFRLITLQLVTMGAIVVVGVILGLLWSRFGPPRR